MLTSDHVQAIAGGCACFWGGILTLGVVYLSVVFVRQKLTRLENGDSGTD